MGICIDHKFAPECMGTDVHIEVCVKVLSLHMCSLVHSSAVCYHVAAGQQLWC